MRVSGFVFWMAVKTKYEIFATTHRFHLDLGRNRSVVNGDSDKNWFILITQAYHKGILYKGEETLSIYSY